MSDNTERLIVDVDASGVNAGAKSLEDLVTAATGAGKAADGLADKFDETGAAAKKAAAGVDSFNDEAKQTEEAAGDAAVGLYRQNQEFQKLLDRINPTRVGLRDLAEQQAALAKGQAGGFISAKEAEQYNQMLKAREDLLKRNESALKGYGSAAKDTKTLQDGLTISTGQYNAAIGMLPAQMTDVFTQLAGGQNPFLILIQQGGQIQDSFGGVDNVLTMLKDTVIDSATSLGELKSAFADVRDMSDAALLRFGRAVTVLGAGLLTVVAGLGYAAYTSSDQTDRLTSSLILMGGAGFTSAKQLNEAAEAIANKTGSSISETIDTLIELNNKGNATAEQMTRIATATQKMSDAGLDAGDSMKQFDSIIKDPVKGLAKLNEQYGFIDEKEMKRLITLQKTKGDQAAVTEAINIYANAMEKRSDDVVDATDNIGQAWNSLKSGASNVFRDIGITLRAWGNQAIDIVSLVKLSFQDLINNLESLDSKFTVGVSNMLSKIPGVDGKGVLSAIGIDVDEVEKRGNESIAKGKKIAEEFAKIKNKVTAPNAQYIYEQEVREGGGVAGSGGTDQKSRNAVSKLASEAAKHNKEKAITVSQGDRILEQYQAQELALRAQIKTLKDRNAFDVNASEQMKNYQLLVAKISILEGIRADAKGRALTKDEQSLLASKEEILAKAKTVGLLGDQVKQLERQAQITDELTRSGNDLSVQVAAINASWGLSADEAARLLENMQRAAALRDKGATQEQIDEDARQREALRQATDAKTQDWAGGARSAIEAWGKDATNTSANVQKVITGAMDAGLDSINSFVMTGKASFADFTKSILGMMVQMINKWLMFKAIQGIGGAMGFDMSSIGFNAKGGVYDSPSLSAYSNRVYTTPQLFTYDKPKPFAKGGVFAEAGPEAIMPLAKDSSGRLGVRAQGGAGGGVSIGSMEVNVDQNGQATANVSESGKLGRAYGDAMAAAIQDGIARASSPGGQIWMLINGHA